MSPSEPGGGWTLEALMARQDRIAAVVAELAGTAERLQCPGRPGRGRWVAAGGTTGAD